MSQIQGVLCVLLRRPLQYWYIHSSGNWGCWLPMSHSPIPLLQWLLAKGCCFSQDYSLSLGYSAPNDCSIYVNTSAPLPQFETTMMGYLRVPQETKGSSEVSVADASQFISSLCQILIPSFPVGWWTWEDSPANLQMFLSKYISA